MDRNQKYKNGQMFGRASDIAVEESTKHSIEATMTAHYAAGNHDSAMMGINMLTKLSAEKDISAVLQSMVEQQHQTTGVLSVMAEKLGMNNKNE